MDNEKFALFEKTFLMSKKFLAFFIITLALVGQNVFALWQMTSANEMNMWAATWMIVNSIGLAFVGLAFNVSQARLDSAVRLAAVLGDKLDFKNLPKQIKDALPVGGGE